MTETIRYERSHWIPSGMKDGAFITISVHVAAGGFTRATNRTWLRKDRHSSGRPDVPSGHEDIIVVGASDYSIRYEGHDDFRDCGCCWLVRDHSELYHEYNLKWGEGKSGSVALATLKAAQASAWAACEKEIAASHALPRWSLKRWYGAREANEAYTMAERIASYAYFTASARIKEE